MPRRSYATRRPRTTRVRVTVPERASRINAAGLPPIAIGTAAIATWSGSSEQVGSKLTGARLGRVAQRPDVGPEGTGGCSRRLSGWNARVVHHILWGDARSRLLRRLVGRRWLLSPLAFRSREVTGDQCACHPAEQRGYEQRCPERCGHLGQQEAHLRSPIVLDDEDEDEHAQHQADDEAGRNARLGVKLGHESSIARLRACIRGSVAPGRHLFTGPWTLSKGMTGP